MQLEINSEDIDSSGLKHILKFYLSRLDDRVSRLTIRLEKFEQSQGVQFRVHLNATLNDGSHFKLIDMQNDKQLATQRILDRLVRHLQFQRRRQRYLNHY